MEGRLGDLEGSEYECKLRYGLLHWSQRQFGLDNAYLALTQNDPLAPQLSRSTARATGKRPDHCERVEDLYLADIIMLDQGNRHILVEASITLGEDDINRAKRRASILGAATGGDVTAAVVTTFLNSTAADQATADGVAVFTIHYPLRRRACSRSSSSSNLATSSQLLCASYVVLRYVWRSHRRGVGGRPSARLGVRVPRPAAGTNTSCSCRLRDQVRENLTTRRPGPQSPGWTT